MKELQPFFLLPLKLSRNNSIGNACYAGYVSGEESRSTICILYLFVVICCNS